jgi:hypothetical protein
MLKYAQAIAWQQTPFFPTTILASYEALPLLPILRSSFLLYSYACLATLTRRFSYNPEVSGSTRKRIFAEVTWVLGFLPFPYSPDLVGRPVA